MPDRWPLPAVEWLAGAAVVACVYYGLKIIGSAIMGAVRDDIERRISK